MWNPLGFDTFVFVNFVIAQCIGAGLSLLPPKAVTKKKESRKSEELILGDLMRYSTGNISIILLSSFPLFLHVQVSY